MIITVISKGSRASQLKDNRVKFHKLRHQYLNLISQQRALQLAEFPPEGQYRGALSFRKVNFLTSPATSLPDKVGFDLERTVPAVSCLR